jgi:hypothetical protein
MMNNTFYTVTKIDPSNLSIISSCTTPDDGYACLSNIITGINVDGFLIFKFDSAGNLEWSKKFWFQDYTLFGTSMNCAVNGDLIISSTMRTKSGPGTQKAVLDYAYIIKLDALGNVKLRQPIGSGSTLDYGDNNTGDKIRFTRDGGYILVGTASGINNGTGILVSKFASNDSLQWIKQIDGINLQQKNSVADVVQTRDGNYVVVGRANHYGNPNTIVIYKCNSNGNLIWGKMLGNENYVSTAIQSTSDGGCVIAGFINFSNNSASIYNMLLVKINIDGYIVWSKVSVGSDYDQLYFVNETTEGDLIIGGEKSWLGQYGFKQQNVFLAKVNSSGDLLWAKIVKNSLPSTLPSASASTAGINQDGHIMLGGGFTVAPSDGSQSYSVALTASFDTDGNIPGCETVVDISANFSFQTGPQNTTDITSKVSLYNIPRQTRTMTNWLAVSSDFSVITEKFCAGETNQTLTTVTSTTSNVSGTSTTQITRMLTATNLTTSNSISNNTFTSSNYSPSPITFMPTTSLSTMDGATTPASSIPTGNNSNLNYLWFLVPGAIVIMIAAILYSKYKKRNRRQRRENLLAMEDGAFIAGVPAGSSLRSFSGKLTEWEDVYTNDKSPDQTVLQPEQELQQQIEDFLFRNKQLPDKFHLNDRRENNFYKAYPQLKELCGRLRLEDCIDAARIILKTYGRPFPDTNRIVIDELLDDEDSITLADAIGRLLTRINRQLKDAGFAGTSLKYDDLLKATHLLLWQQQALGVITIQKDKSNNYLLVQVDEPQGEMTLEQIQEFQAMQNENPPAWFVNLPDWEKRFWGRLIEEDRQLNSLRKAPQPILKRGYPGLPNKLTHHLFVYDKNNNRLIFHTQSIRSGVVDPFSVSVANERAALVDMNILQVLTHDLPAVMSRRLHNIQQNYSFGDKHKPKLCVPILLQTLLTEVGREGGMVASKSSGVDEIKQQLKGLQNISDSIELIILESNYPLNSLGRLLGLEAPLSARCELATGLLRCVVSQLKLLRSCKPALDGTDLNNLDELIEWLSSQRQIEILDLSQNQKYKKFFEIGFPPIIQTTVRLIMRLFNNYLQQLFHADTRDNNYYLSLAALEKNLVKLLGGLAYLTCRSGKDRTAILIITEDNDLFLIFLSDKPINEQERAQQYVDILLSGHHQLIASLNASGSIGLKSLEDILANEVERLLASDIKELNDQCANSNNEANKSKLPIISNDGIAAAAKLRLRLAIPMAENKRDEGASASAEAKKVVPKPASNDDDGDQAMGGNPDVLAEDGAAASGSYSHN